MIEPDTDARIPLDSRRYRIVGVLGRGGFGTVYMARMTGADGFVKDVAIKEDSDVPPAGCIIETDSGTIDAQLSTQLEMIQRVLLADPSSSEGPA